MSTASDDVADVYMRELRVHAVARLGPGAAEALESDQCKAAVRRFHASLGLLATAIKTFAGSEGCAMVLEAAARSYREALVDVMSELRRAMLAGANCSTLQ